jgi:hypothetical protein
MAVKKLSVRPAKSRTVKTSKKPARNVETDALDTAEFWRPNGFVVGMRHNHNTEQYEGRFDLRLLAKQLAGDVDRQGGCTIMSMLDLAEGYAEVAWRFNPERDPETGKGYPDPNAEDLSKNPEGYPGRDPARGGADDPRLEGLRSCFVALMCNRPMRLPVELRQQCCEVFAATLFNELRAEAEQAVENAKATFASPTSPKD